MRKKTCRRTEHCKKGEKTGLDRGYRFLYNAAILICCSVQRRLENRSSKKNNLPPITVQNGYEMSSDVVSNGCNDYPGVDIS